MSLKWQTLDFLNGIIKLQKMGKNTFSKPCIQEGTPKLSTGSSCINSSSLLLSNLINFSENVGDLETLQLRTSEN